MKCMCQNEMLRAKCDIRDQVLMAMINIRGDPRICCYWLPLVTSSRVAANGNQQQRHVVRFKVFFRRPKFLLGTNL
jgi:hypothetical protein